MKTLRLLLAQAAAVCAVGAFGEVRVDTKGCLVKVTFVGDAMCPGLMLAPYRTAAGGYDYTSICFSCYACGIIPSVRGLDFQQKRIIK